MEGARDRNALKWPQIPILSLPGFPASHSVLMNWLTPDATYYGGIFNNVLNSSQIDEILSIGYQPIVSNSLATNITNHDAFMIQWKNWSCKGYVNQLDNYNSYGPSLNCPQLLIHSYCCAEGYLGPPYCQGLSAGGFTGNVVADSSLKTEKGTLIIVLSLSLFVIITLLIVILIKYNRKRY